MDEWTLGEAKKGDFGGCVEEVICCKTGIILLLSNQVRTHLSVSIIPKMQQTKIDLRQNRPDRKISHHYILRLIAAPAAKQDHTIRARDYKPLDPPEPKIACYSCGKKGSWYVEKFTAERKARTKEQQDARRICKACYKEAVRAEQMASVPLPGTIDVSRFTRVTADVGKCSVCGLERSVWIDRTTHVLLCEHCYGREVRENVREAGVV